MAVNPYSFKDQHTQEWQQKQRELAGGLTGGTIFDPPHTYNPPPTYNPLSTPLNEV